MQNLIFEKSKPGRRAVLLPPTDVPGSRADKAIPQDYVRKIPPALPEVSELDAVRHFVNLSQLNQCIDKGFYPLGSCTMKYNPKVNDALAALEGFRELHPWQPVEQVQGALEVMWNLERSIAEIIGLPAVSLQPAAGAHGELVGLLLIKAYFQDRGDHEVSEKVIVPDTAHGTNPATAALAGFEVVEIKSNSRGTCGSSSTDGGAGPGYCCDLCSTNPNTLGLFEEDIQSVQKLVHEAGTALL